MKEKIKQCLRQHFFLIEQEGWYDADKIAEDLAKVFSSNAVLAVTSDSKENNKESEVEVCRCLEPVKLIDTFDNLRCGWCNGIIK